MRVFISWSGKRSERVASLLHWWLKCVIQACDPWVSSEDIESGSIWFNEINDQLASTTVGIICLTRENKDKPWILFETGALMKGLGKSRVCPLLIDLETQEVKPPLSQLNSSSVNYDGVFKIVKAINNSLAEKALGSIVLEQVFKTYWPQFEQSLQSILESTEDVPADVRAEGDILNELLLTVRGFDRRIANIERGTLNLQDNKPIHERFGMGRRVYTATMVVDPALNYSVDSMTAILIGEIPFLEVIDKKSQMQDGEQYNVFIMSSYCSADLIKTVLENAGYFIIRAFGSKPN